MTRTYVAVAAAAAAFLAGSALAAPNYQQGFETDASGWVNQTNASGTSSSLTRTAAGNGMTANSGSYYGTLTSSPNAYSDSGAAGPGYGEAGYTRFGAATSSGQTYPGNPFTQSVAVYVNTQTAAPAMSGAAYWIDAAPSANDGSDARYGGEHSFQLSYTGSAVTVGFDGTVPAVNIGTSGWYTFQFLYSNAGAASALSTTTLSVLSGNTVLGSSTLANNSDGAMLTNGNLGGTGYLWFTVFQNGFSNNTLAIDDIRAAGVPGTVPEPASWAMMVAGFGLIGSAMRRRKTAVRFA